MTSYLARHVGPGGATPQSEPIAGTVPNSAGGHAFPVDDWTRLERFLILGSEGGSYYIGERSLTRENAGALQRCIAADGLRTVETIVAISVAGRAPKNEVALFALALAMKTGDERTRRAASDALHKVARTGTDLFHLADFVQAFGGWGRATKRAFGDWYARKPIDKLALQAVKYRQRDGWTHRDLLRLGHPVAAIDDSERRALFDWICGREQKADVVPSIVRAYQLANAEGMSAVAIAAMVRTYALPREAVPTTALNSVEVWDALLADMPLTAMIRSLAKMTAIGLLKPLGEATAHVCRNLRDEAALKRARVHPLALLLAQRIYASGRGELGSLTWTPVEGIVDALDAGFYGSFQAVEPTGKRIMLALDVSHSMAAHRIAKTPLTPREGSSAMALVTAATEERHHIVGFTSGATGEWGGGRSMHRHYRAALAPVPISPRMRLKDAMRVVEGMPMGGTDCALPMLYALDQMIGVDAFVVYTDNETWAGNIHPVEALRLYRAKTGIAAKLVVVGMVSNGFTIADPNDGGMLDVVGFDTATPAVIADFIRQ